MSEQKISQGMSELVAARAGCRQCEARIEINEKLHEHNIALGKLIAKLDADTKAQAKRNGELIVECSAKADHIAELEAAINCADELLEMGMRELAQNELRKALEEGDGIT